MEATPEADDSDATTLPPLLALPDSVLVLVASRLPSPDKKAARLVCRALRTSINASVASFLVTDANLPFIAPYHPDIQLQPQPDNIQLQPQQQKSFSPPPPQQQQPSARCGAPLHATFPNLTHLCLCLSPSAGPETRRAEQLRRLLRHSLPALHALRCLDLSLACRDVVLGRTTAEVYDTWATIVEGLPASRTVRLLLHPPTALVGGRDGGAGPCTAAAVAAATAAAAAANDYLLGREWAGTGGAGAAGCSEAYGQGAAGSSGTRTGGGGGVGSGTGAGAGGGRMTCLLASMLALLGTRRPAAEVRLVTAPLASKRYDKPRIPSYKELLEALTPLPPPPPSTGPMAGGGASMAGSGFSDPAGRCPKVTGLVLGPDSFDPGGGGGDVAATQTIAARVSPEGGAGGSGAGHEAATGFDGGGGGGGGWAWAWLPLLAAANAGVGGAVLEQLVLWEAWPLRDLFGLPSLLSSSSSSSLTCCCLLGLRRLVLSDQQAVLDRDRLSADALAPLSALTRLTRLELSSLTINASKAAAAAASGAVRGSAVQRRYGGGASRASRGRASASSRVLPLTPLPQVRHLSVYHALRVIWPTDTAADPYGNSGAASPAAAPLATLFPGLRHLSANVTHGSPGRPASERWGYLAGLGGCLTSLHLRAVAAEDLCLQGRSEVLAALTRVTSLRLSAESGKVDGIRGLARTIACLGSGLAALRLSHLATRGTDPRAAELALPRLTRLDFLGCSGDLVAAFDGLALSAVRLRRLQVRECETVRPGDLRWAMERQMGLRQLIIQDCPGLLSAPRGTAAAAAAAAQGPAAAAAATLGASQRPGLQISVATTPSEEARALRRSRRRFGGPWGCPAAANVVEDEATQGLSFYRSCTADDLDEL